MKYILSLFAVCSFSLTFSQSFNRALLNYKGETVRSIAIMEAGTFALTQQFSGDQSNRKGTMIRFDDSGNPTKTYRWESDTLGFLLDHIMKDSDSTMIVYGGAQIPPHNGITPAFSTYLYAAKLDTALNLISEVYLKDTAQTYPYHLASISGERKLFITRDGYYILNENFSTLERVSVPVGNGINVFALELDPGRILIQSTGGHYVVDTTDQVTKVPLMNNWGGSRIHDFSDSSFFIFNRIAGELYIFEKATLAPSDTIFVDNLSGYDVKYLSVLDDYLITASATKYFTVFSTEDFTVLRNDSLHTDYYGNMVTQTADIHNGVVAFVSNIGTCRQSHVEVFGINDPLANPFGEVVLKSTAMNFSVIGGPFSSDRSDYSHMFEVDVNFDVRIINKANQSLDSLKISYYTYPTKNPCNGGDFGKMNSLMLNLIPGDSTTVTYTDTLIVYTNDPNSIQLNIIKYPAVANGNIIAPIDSSSITDSETGLGLAEGNFLIRYYPNPVDNQLTIHNKKLLIEEIKIISLTGELLQTHILDKSEIHLDVSDLKAGIYFVNLSGRAYNETFKILVE